MSSVKRALEGQYLVDASMDDHYLVVYDMTGQFSGLGDSVVVLDATSLEPIAEFTNQADDEVPYGFTLVSGTLLLQTYNTNGCLVHTARTYALSPSGATPLAHWSFFAACKNDTGRASGLPHIVGKDGYAVLEPIHQVVRVDPLTGVMTLIPRLRQGSFERERRSTAGLVEMQSSMSNRSGSR